MFYYSTNPDAMRPEEPEVVETLAPDRQKLRVSLERKGRGGKTATIVNCKAWVNIRAKASSNSKKLGTANKGSTWTVQGRSGNWIQVDYSGTSAFIYKRYVKIG